MTKRELKRQQTQVIIETLQDKFGAKNFDNDQGSYFTFNIGGFGGILMRNGFYVLINEAIKMLENAYASKSNDPYIIDSIGWAYYLIEDYNKAEKFLKRAVELMPDDPIVNDHYGDILWKLNRKIQARYFWSNVLKMEDIEEDMIKKINLKMAKGLQNS